MRWINDFMADRRIRSNAREVSDERMRRERKLDEYMGEHDVPNATLQAIRDEEAARARAAMGEPTTTGDRPLPGRVERPAPGIEQRPGVYGSGPLSTADQLSVGRERWGGYADEVMGTRTAQAAAGVGMTQQARDRFIMGEQERGTEADRFMSRLEHEKELKEMDVKGAMGVAGIAAEGKAQAEAARRADEAARQDEYQGAAVRGEGGAIGLWDTKEQRYKWQFPPAQGGETEITPKGTVTVRSGGRPFNVGDVPEYRRPGGQEEEVIIEAPDGSRRAVRASSVDYYVSRGGKVVR